MRVFKPVSRSTLGEQIAMQIFGMVSDSAWKPGEKLPSELELCKALHVGRSSLREAMKSLAFVGIVEVHPGEGTYVAEGPSKFLGHILAQGMLKSIKDLADLFEARVMLEPELAALCAQRVTAEELQILDDVMAEMQRSLSERGDRFSNFDLEFHLAIAAGSRNQTLSGYLRAIRGPLQELITKGAQSHEYCELAYAQHLKILEALKQHSPAGARRSMRSHLRTFQRGYLILRRASESEFIARRDSMVS